MMAHSKEVSIITGGSKGIGLSIAEKFASMGHALVLISRKEEGLKNACEDLRKKGADVIYFAGDVGNSSFANKVADEVIGKYGRIDHLINNAGFGIFKKIVDSDEKEFRNQMNTNLFGVYNFTKAVLPQMIKQKSGSIINIASLAGKNAFVGGAMYSATKHALLGFSRTLMLEVREYDIRVSTILPGSVDTSFGQHEELDPRSKGNILLAEDVAEVVASVIKLPARALASEIDLRPTNPKKT